jgi:hypothetical protein
VSLSSAILPTESLVSVMLAWGRVISTLIREEVARLAMDLFNQQNNLSETGLKIEKELCRSILGL